PRLMGGGRPARGRGAPGELRRDPHRQGLQGRDQDRPVQRAPLCPRHEGLTAMPRDWRGLAALDNLDEIERRVRNLFANPCRSWTRIDWYESRPVSVSPSIKPGLALAGEYGGEIMRRDRE